MRFLFWRGEVNPNCMDSLEQFLISYKMVPVLCRIHQSLTKFADTQFVFRVLTKTRTIIISG